MFIERLKHSPPSLEVLIPSDGGYALGGEDGSETDLLEEVVGVNSKEVTELLNGYEFEILKLCCDTF
jgi:hypothetical protein